jgi:SAM-dependent methyltransferase
LTLQAIEIPETIKKIPHSVRSESLIDTANERIESFMLEDDTVDENFVPCDFHLLDQALTWIDQNHLAAGKRFCELGSGFGVGAMLAAIRGMESVGIEIQEVLVDESSDLADELEIDAKFFAGSFIPRDVPSNLGFALDVRHVETDEGDVYDEIGLEMNDFDLFFAFPWPGEHEFFESIFDACAADGALLLTYRGREGMHLVRKVD